MLSSQLQVNQIETPPWSIMNDILRYKIIILDEADSMTKEDNGEE